MRFSSSSVLTGLALALFVACGGGSAPAPTGTGPAATTQPAGTPATSLEYVDPAGSGWRLVKDASSTSTRIVLNLVGPSGTLTRGVGMNLKAPATVAFDTFGNGLPINDTGVFELLSTNPNPTDPYAIVGGVKSGNLLSVGIYQKDRALTAKDSALPLCQIALTMAAIKPSVGDALPLSVPKAKVIPSDIGNVNDDLYTLGQKMRMTDISVAVGTLTAK